MLQKLSLSALCLTISIACVAQKPKEQPSSSEIIHKLKTLQTLGSVLYIAAHPDDENTRLISYLSNGKHMRTGYLSLTRGSGGQNLIGERLGDPLGIIRTNELLEARRVDGGIQYFTRAVDFGYSKTAKESLEKWGKNEILGDMVRVIRHFKPDVIITRFPPDSRGGHGHHQASAILALEAFDLAADPKAFPEQLEQGLDVWKTRRLFWNGSSWWDKTLPEKAETDPDWVDIDVGQYDPLLGLSYTELAGRSRSMHKSQGFGAAQTKGSKIEYLHLEKGDKVERNDAFEGIDMSWSRLLGGNVIDQLIRQLIRQYDPQRPERIADTFELFHDELLKLPESHWRAIKIQELEDLMIDITATDIELLADEYLVPTGKELDAEFNMLARANFAVDMKNASSLSDINELEENLLLTNELNTREVLLKAGKTIDQPFWLSKNHDNLFDVATQGDYFAATQAQELRGRVRLKIAGVEIEREIPAMHKWVDRVDGERVRPVVVTPPASLKPSQNIAIVNQESISIGLEVESLVDELNGKIAIALPNGWSTTKDIKLVQGLKKGERKRFNIVLNKGKKAEPGFASFSMEVDGIRVDKTMHEIDHLHILPQVYYTPCRTKLVPLNVQVTAKRVGYIPGAGDLIPDALNEMGVSVEMIDTKNTSLDQLKSFDAVVTGIRAYNTDPELKYFNKTLLEYVKQGGVMLVQYNTNRGLMEGIGPYPFKVTRNRVTVEEAPANLLQRDNPLLKRPNVLGPEDFEGWVQERGLYFTDEQDEHYTKLISWNDPGEEPLDGGLIYCDYGQGRFVYTGISFFRQLPAGVPGAYRLFANLISK